MKPINIIFSIYLAIFQFNPFIHLHSHEHDGNIEYHISIHPPEVSEETQCHNHQQSHPDYQLNSADKYTLIENTFKILEPVELTGVFWNLTQQPLIHFLTTQQPNITDPISILLRIIPDRAPPSIV